MTSDDNNYDVNICQSLPNMQKYTFQNLLVNTIIIALLNWTCEQYLGKGALFKSEDSFSSKPCDVKPPPPAYLCEFDL
jgi:hypothetical protein